jgi:hypothetical protein
MRCSFLPPAKMALFFQRNCQVHVFIRLDFVLIRSSPAASLNILFSSFCRQHLSFLRSSIHSAVNH